MAEKAQPIAAHAMNPKVTLLRNKNLRSWPPMPNTTKGSEDWERHCLANTKKTWVVPLETALTSEYTGDVYFVAYAPNPINRRLRVTVLEHPEALAAIGGSVKMQLAMFDIDYHVSDTFESEEERFERVRGWWNDELEKIDRLVTDMPGLIVYQSKNGYKILGLLREPFHIRSKADVDPWKRMFGAWLNYLAEEYDIRSVGGVTGDQLLDWQRLQRIPHDGNRSPLQPDKHEVIGDPANVGYWEPKLKDHHWPPLKVVKQKVERKWEGDDGCLLLELIQRAGLRWEPVAGGSGDYDICCPDWARHSPDARGLKDYPTKTRLLASPPLGSILCQSSGCLPRANEPKQWLSFFSDEEIEAAERALGRCNSVECGKPTFCDILPKGLSARTVWMICNGLPNEAFFADEFLSRDPDKDRAKSQSQWIHEILCGCLQAEIPYEQVLGFFDDRGWGLSSLRLTHRYLKFRLKLALEPAKLEVPTFDDSQLSAYVEWCLAQTPLRDPENPDNRKDFLDFTCL